MNEPRRPIEAYLSRLEALLGWRKLIERRALAELRDHLESSAHAGRRDGVSEIDAELAAIEALRGVDESLRVVVESSRTLSLLEMTKDRMLLLACLLTLPGVLLLGLGFLTFNFPCSSIEAGQGAAAYVYERCGVPSLQFLRPWLADFGLYGAAPWYQVTQFALTTLGPLAAALLLLAGQTHVRFDRAEGSLPVVVLVRPGAHRMVALAAATTVFVAVAAYKLAG